MDLKQLKEKQESNKRTLNKKLGLLLALFLVLGISIGLNVHLILSQPGGNPPGAIPPNGTVTTPKYDLVEKGNASITDLYNNVSSSVVLVEVTKSNGLKTGNQGSGFIYRSDGYIITNNHVVENSEDVTVTLPEGDILEAEIVGTDPYSDLALLKVNKTGLKPIPLGNIENIEQGETTLAIGNPFGLQGTITKGIVSQKDRLLDTEEGFTIPNVIQTDAAINPGNSGGPLINIKGEVIGVNTAIRSGTGNFIGIGFAVSVKTIKKIIPKLMQNKDVKYSWIGVKGRDMSPKIAEKMDTDQKKGVLIVEVISDGPADEAGIEGGDRTVKINGRDIEVGGDIIKSMEGKEMHNMNDLVSYISQNTKPGDEIDVTVIRDGEEKELTLTLGKRSEAER